MVVEFSENPNLVIDVHTHVYLPRYMEYLRNRTQVPRVFSNDQGGERLVILPGEDSGDTVTGRPVGPEYYDPAEKLGFMARHGIDVSIVRYIRENLGIHPNSLANPWLDFLAEDEANDLAKDLNQDLQGWCDAYPQLYGFGVLPTLSVQGSIAELERIALLPKLKGVIMGTHGLGKGLDDAALEPVFAKVAELGLVIFLHPHYGISTEAFGERENGHVLPLALGFPFETTLVRFVNLNTRRLFPDLS